MKILINIIVCLSIPFICFSQIKVSEFDKKKYPFKEWDAQTLNSANTFKYANYMSSEEKMIVYYCNLARMNRSLFVRTFVQLYKDSLSISDSDMRKLRKKARFAPTLTPLRPHKDLYQLAKNIALISTKETDINHKEVDKKSERLRKRFRNIGHCYSFGSESALNIVVSLLLLDISEKPEKPVEIKNLLFRKRMRYIGPIIKSHLTEKYVSIICLGEL